MSMDSPVLHSRDFTLVPFRVADVDETYQSWLNDPDVVRFLEVRHFDRSLLALKAYVEQAQADSRRHFFLIKCSQTRQKVGTMSLYIDNPYGVAHFGYLIGARQFWGSPAAIQSQVALLDFAFGPVGLRRVWGGVYARNAASHFNYRRLGFTREGVQRQHVIEDGVGPSDVVIYGMLAEEWQAQAHRFAAHRPAV